MLSVFRNGTETILDDGSFSYLVGDAGWGMAKPRRLSEFGPLQDGETDIGFRLQPRSAQLVLQLNESSRESLYEKRDLMQDIFAPSDTALNLRWVWGSKQRQIDVHTLGISFDSNYRTGFSQKAVLVFRAPAAVFYDPVSRTETFALGGGSDSFSVPMSVGHGVGASTLDVLTSVEVRGNWRSYPHRLRIVGPLEDPKIRNDEDGKVLDFTGITIASGDHYDLDLRYGYKTVVDSNGVNKIHELTSDSDLSSWVLLPKTEVAGGFNSLHITGTSATEETSVAIDWFDNYLGI